MGEEEESIEYLLMPRRRNFDALVRKNGTFHIGNDFVERSQRRFPDLVTNPYKSMPRGHNQRVVDLWQDAR